MSRDIELEALAKWYDNFESDGQPYDEGYKDALKHLQERSRAILASPGTLHGGLREAFIAGARFQLDINLGSVGESWSEYVALEAERRYPEASHPAPAPATRLCPVKHGAEHEMDLVWYCETCGHREAT